jgi:glycosyltransferase involved in cell wall biosynthesis
MHIAINGWFWDQPNVGSGQYLRGLLAALCRVAPQTQFTLVLPSHIGAPQAIPDGVQVLTTSGGLPGKLGKVWFEQRQFPAAVATSGAGLAHVPYWGPPLRSPVPLVTSVLDAIPLIFPAYAGGFFNRLYVSMVRAAAQGSTRLITLSEASAQDIAAHFNYPSAHITPIHLAPKPVYHPKMGSQHDPDVRRKYNLPDDPFVLYVGGFDVRKRLDQLIGAYSFVYRAHGEYIPLVIAGQQPTYREPLFPDPHEVIAAHKIHPDDVRWIGYVDEDDMPALYRLAEVFVYPTAYEGFGLPLLEAMASGTPAVANEIPVFEEIVGDGAFLVQDGSETKMGGAILALLEQRDLYDSLSNRGIARASNFTWRKTAKATLRVYEQALHASD